MYLKTLEMCGFKSFADKTKLVFEPGLIAIVGPNGCGKSNVSDAIRWVLGEQRPTALRGSRMLDVIFNGADKRKQMSMAEVSITFADCDKTIDTEFNEITITRRVFRTGESAYYMNKVPCRLKDIQRLFMGTGIGHTSYSVMAQGQIDAILSSRPEDRRTIFEEAAGITKYKADRREAMRKLEQTEANLLRLADVIREVKRQIGNLQRQVSKAQHYRELKSELRSFDIFAAQSRIGALQQSLAAVEGESGQIALSETSELAELADRERAVASLRLESSDNEDRINTATESVTQAESELAHSCELIRIGEQRIDEYKAWAERDANEVRLLREQLETLLERIGNLKRRGAELEVAVEETAATREAIHRRISEEKIILDGRRRDLAAKRDEALERERRSARLRNRISEMDAEFRSANVRRERLKGEHNKLKDDLERMREAARTHSLELDSLRKSAESLEQTRKDIEAALAEIRAKLGSLREETVRQTTQLATKRAQIDLLAEQEAGAESFQSGSRLLLDKANPLGLPDGVVLGSLASKFKASAEYRTALEAVLRAWIDAVAVRDISEARTVIRALLSSGGAAAARIVASGGKPAPEIRSSPCVGLRPLSDFVSLSADFKSAGERLLANVFVADTLDAVPEPPPPDCVVVTLSGAVFRPDGLCELWAPDSRTMSPLARRMTISDGMEQIAAMESKLSALREELSEVAHHEAELQAESGVAVERLGEANRAVAQKEGELRGVSRDMERAAERVAVVAEETRFAEEQTRLADEEKSAVEDELGKLEDSREAFIEGIAAMQSQLQESELDFNDRNQSLIEAQIREANKNQELTNLIGQIENCENRRLEILRTIEGRESGLSSYDSSVKRLTAQIEQTRQGLEPMRQSAERLRAELEELKNLRCKKNQELRKAEEELDRVRKLLEITRNRRAQLDIERASLDERRRNRLDRICHEYSLTPEEFEAEAKHLCWRNGAPAIEEAERKITELSNAIEAIGPVNLVAVEECKELEARYELDKAQEDDLLKSKEQIIELLRVINRKSAEMFRDTFEQANANFGKMFAKFFNGGTARLELVENEEDPLECGVEIIARPPGKRLQSISLLSGGERTMTAVSLLFAIYLIKPSPFCLLDELDAALDDQNIGRFVQALKDFLSQSQFLIITHNQHSIANSGIVYGVTMPEKGVSKIVSMRLPDIGVRELQKDDYLNETGAENEEQQ